MAIDPRILDEFWQRSDAPMPALYRTIQQATLWRHKRSQVFPTSHDSVQGKQIGISQNNLGRVYCTPFTEHDASIVKQVRRQLEEVEPTFHFTALYISRGCRAKLHIDDHNAGPSYQVALGPHEGGSPARVAPHGLSRAMGASEVE